MTAITKVKFLDATGHVVCEATGDKAQHYYDVTRPTKDAQIKFTQVSYDINGNSRHVCHFLSLCTAKELASLDDIGLKYARALKRSRQLGGRKFHNKQYGGGIVFKCGGNTDGLSEEIRRVVSCAESNGE